MNYLSTNIRGAGDSLKAEHIKELKRLNNINFIAVQETQFTDSAKLLVKNFWGNSIYDSDFVNASGRSGGLLNIWDPNIFVCKPSVSKRSFMATLGELTNGGEKINVVNIYAPHDNSLKKELWLELSVLIEPYSGSKFNPHAADSF